MSASPMCQPHISLSSFSLSARDESTDNIPSWTSVARRGRRRGERGEAGRGEAVEKSGEDTAAAAVACWSWSPTEGQG